MANIIQIKRSLTTDTIPSVGSLSEGELAVNIIDKKLWIGDTSGDPIELIDKNLNDIIDVDSIDPSQGDRLGFDESTNNWIPMASISGLGIVSFDYKYEAVDTIPPPDEGFIMCDNIDPVLVTKLYIHRLDRLGGETDTFWSEIKEHDWFNIYRSNDESRFENYDVTGSSIDQGDYWEVPVSYYSTQGTAIGNGDRVKVDWRISASFPHEILVDRDAPDSHPIYSITDLDTNLLSKMNWKNVWVDGTYEVNDVVRDGDWTMVANKQTIERPAPVSIGDPYEVYTGAGLVVQSANAKQLITGARFTTISTDVEFLSYSIFTRIGDEYDVYIVEDPLGSKIITSLLSFSGTVDGWVEFSLVNKIYFAGSVIDIISIKVESEAIHTDFNGTWDYVSPQQPGTPSTGQILHSVRDEETLKVHKTDNDGIDRSTELLGLSIGDRIYTLSIEWIIQDVIDNGSVIEYEVTPQTRDNIGVKNFIFESIIPSELFYKREDNYWPTSTYPSIQGMFIEDGKYGDIVPDDHAYGINIKIQTIETSDDWDVLSHSTSTGTGGSDPVDDLVKYKEPLDTGLVSGGMITTNTGLIVSIESGTGIVVDSTTDPLNIIKTDVIWDASDVTITPISNFSHEIHELSVDINGVVTHTPIELKTPEFTYTNISLGWVEVDEGVIVSVVNSPHAVAQTSYNLFDLFKGLTDESKAKGMRIRASSGLDVYVESGVLLIPGINWYTNRRHQNVLEIDQVGDDQNPVTLGIYNINSESVISPQTTIPKYYDDNGTYTSLTGSESVIHYMFYTSSGYSIQLGQKPYKNFADAFRNIDRDRNEFIFAPSTNVPGRSILLGVIIISKLANDFTNKSLADIVSTINGETGNTISPIDLTLVPQYLLHTTASEDLTTGDLLSMNINGDLQKYPATGGEGSSQYTTDNVDIHSAIFLNASNNQGIITWKNDTSTSTIYFVTAQGNANGSVSYSPVGSITGSGVIEEIRTCKISDTHAGMIWRDGAGVHLRVVQNDGINVAPTSNTPRTIDGNTIQGCDVSWDSSQNNLIGVFTTGSYVYNRWCKISGNSVSSPPESRVGMNSCRGEEVQCETEGNNIIVTALYNGSSYWVEGAWDKGWLNDGFYDDLTNVRSHTGGTQHCGMKVQLGTILAQFENDGSIQTYQATYSSGGTMNTPTTYGISKVGKSADLIKTTSGIGYSIILKSNGVIEVWEGTLSGTYELVYTSTLNVGTNVTHIQALMFGSVFAVGAIGDYVWANDVILIDSSVTRTDHFIAVAPSNILQGQKFNADIALPMITLPREYPPGTMYEYGPYKYQVITHNQAVMIIEATIIQAATI